MILWGNHLTRIEAEVFRSVLEQMMAWNDGGYPYEYTFIYDSIEPFKYFKPEIIKLKLFIN